MGYKMLWQNEWMEIREIDGWYTMAHNTKGDGVAVLGYDKDSSKILVRTEHNPAHGEGFRRTSLTGTIEGGITLLETAVKELKEESGYEADPSEFTELGVVFPSKFSDYRLYLFAVDLTGKQQGAIEGDGTEGEAGADVEWVAVTEAIRTVDDPSMCACILKLSL